MKAYLARHGQTDYNARKICNVDAPDDAQNGAQLTELGIKQSKKLAEHLKSLPLEIIYISELRRTKQTAEIVNKYHGVDLRVDQRLNDNRTGFAGHPKQEFLDAFDRSKDKPNAKFNDGESLEEVKQRTANFMEYLKQQKYKCVLVVTSDIIIQYFYANLNNLSHEQAWNFPVVNGSCMEVEL